MMNYITGKLCPLSFSSATEASLLSQILHVSIYILTGFISISRWQNITGNITQMEHTYLHKLTHSFFEKLLLDWLVFVKKNWHCCKMGGIVICLSFPRRSVQNEQNRTKLILVFLPFVCILLIFVTKSQISFPVLYLRV